MNVGIEEPEEFKLFEFSENDGNSNRNSLIGRESNKSDNNIIKRYLIKD